jgi:spoIIIJ-associated protein
LDEPQILIGQGGQTLFEIQRLLRMVLNKKLQNFFYLNLDINDYKKKKIEYLKDMAKDLADQTVSTKEEKILPAMSSYERRVVHAELSQRADVITESQGDGFDRHIVIKPR